MKKFDTKSLLDLKREVENAKMRISELSGQKKMLLEQLKTQFNCESLEEAKKLIEKMSKEIEEQEKSIEKSIGELYSKYNILI